MFEVNGRYANRSGYYTVLALNPPKMTVRYEHNGEEAELRVNIQERIWDNIQAELEAQEAPRRMRRWRSPDGSSGNYLIKMIDVVTEEDLSVTGLQERLALFADEHPDLQVGDRFVYYARDPKVFFAVATITGPAIATKGTRFIDADGVARSIFPIDVDAYLHKLTGVALIESLDLDSQPNLDELLEDGTALIPLAEDDFEALAELVTEINDDEDAVDDDEDDEDDDVGDDDDVLEL